MSLRKFVCVGWHMRTRMLLRTCYMRALTCVRWPAQVVSLGFCDDLSDAFWFVSGFVDRLLTDFARPHSAAALFK